MISLLNVALTFRVVALLARYEMCTKMLPAFIIDDHLPVKDANCRQILH
jgi:hypothetical protein